MAPTLEPRATQSRVLLINDEGNSALHYLEVGAPSARWTHHGPGRDLQLIGNHRVLRSHPQGYVELDLERRGALAVAVTRRDLPGAIESARRLPSGNTLVAGNGSDGAFLWEFDAQHRAIPERRLYIAGIEKVRMVRRTAQDTYLFCSETDGRSVIHEADFRTGCRAVFEVPKDARADSMVKAVRVTNDVIVVSAGYAASLLRIDTTRKQVLGTIGGKQSLTPPGFARALSPFFFSGYQMFANGDCLVSNWQGHSAAKNGEGYQLLRYDAAGALLWCFDQTDYPYMSSLNNVLALDGLDTRLLHDEPYGVLVPCA